MNEGMIPADLPLRNDLIGEEPYGARRSTCRCASM